MAAHHKRGERSYVGQRHKLIPVAERLTREQFKGVKNVNSFMKDRAFHRHMTVLAIEAELIDKGNLALYDAKSLPKGQFNPNTKKRQSTWV